jgi:hypothetical protein
MRIYAKDGASLEVDIRFALPREAEKIVALMKRQHGGSYMPSFYKAEWIREMMEKGVMRFAVAVIEDGAIAGVIGADVENIFTGSMDLILQVVDKSLRGFGMGKILQGFILDSPDWEKYTCIYGHCLCLDIVSQKNHIHYGYEMTGALLNRYFFDRNSEFFANLDLPLKYSTIVACLPKAKKDAGRIYAPAGKEHYIEDVYRSLGASFTFEEGRPVPPAARLSLTITQNDPHRYLELFVLENGPDLGWIFHQTLEKYRVIENQTYNVFVNLNDSGCPETCRILEDHGFFFTGIQPLSGRYEYAIYHFAPFLKDPFDKVATVPEFASRLDEIKSLYEDQRKALV